MADKFESEYMAGDENVRYRDKRVSRGMAAILGIWAPFCWAMAAFMGFTNATSDKPVPAAALPFVVGAVAGLGFMFLVLALTFAVLRVVVTNTAINVKYGLWGPTILLERIKSCRVVEYEWTKFGGWGIRKGVGNTWAYVPASGDVVEIEYEEDGEHKTVQVGAQNAQQLAREIQRAQNALGMRIEIGDADDAAARDAEAEEELLAAEAGGTTKKKRKRG